MWGERHPVDCPVLSRKATQLHKADGGQDDVEKDILGVVVYRIAR